MSRIQVGYRYNIIENGVRLFGVVTEITGDDVSVMWLDGEITKESLQELDRNLTQVVPDLAEGCENNCEFWVEGCLIAECPYGHTSSA